MSEVSSFSEGAINTTLPLSDEPLPSPQELVWCIHWVFPTIRPLKSPICAAPLVIGRDPSCDVVLGGPSVSRRHAELRVEGQNALLLDLRSRNGTFVNGVRVAHQLLRQNDVLRVGDWLGIVARDIEAASDGRLLSLIADGFYAGPQIRRAVSPLRRAAETDLPIIVQGASGTGKERVARALHEWSGRSGCFIAINCAAIPESLAEAELFGYRKGAFTGADQASLGHIRAAHGGTLFLDEVADLPLAVQAKLLRALEQREVQALGESRGAPIDVRVVVATQDSLSSRVLGGKFRADLHARLNGLTVVLPPLASRPEEVPALFNQFLRDRAGGHPPEIDVRLIERLCLYHWPGNVRELELLVRRLLGLHGHERRLRAAHALGAGLEPNIDASELRPLLELPANSFRALPRDDRDLTMLLAGLREHSGNLARAAEHAGISRQRAYRLLQARPDVDVESFRALRAAE